MAPDVTEDNRIDIGQLMCDAIDNAHRSQKEAYLAMGWDAAQWSKALSGQKGYSLDLRRMVRIPWWFWSEFLPLLGLAVMKVWISDHVGDRKNRGL